MRNFPPDEDKVIILQAASELAKKLSKKHISVKLDNREGRSPGYKFNYWELKGIPIRIEIGPRDLKNDSIIVVRRDTGEKNTVKLEITVPTVIKTLKIIQKNILTRNKAIMKEKIYTANNYEQFKENVLKGFVKVSWCGTIECEEKIKSETTATTRAIPFDEKKKGKCIYCKKDTDIIVYFARSY